MKVLLLVSFMYIQLTLGYETEGTHKDLHNKTMLYSYICDDEKLQDMEGKLNRIVYENEILRLKLDSLNLNINNQFAELKSTSSTGATTTTQSEKVNSNCVYSYDHLIDVRGNYNSDEKNHEKPAMKSKPTLPTSCAEAFQQSGGQQSGIYKIYLPDSKLEPFYVYCLADAEQPEAPWTIVQRRKDGSIDFYRKWSEYQKGFGNMEGEFFIGLDILHALTQSTLHELWIQMEDFEKETRSANYSSFAIGDNSEAYALKILGSFKGNGGDSLTGHAGHKFTTQDVDNDIHDGGNCALDYTGAWWYTKCHSSNLNGKYLGGKTDMYAKGIVWYAWHEHHYSLKYVHMAIRPVQKKKILI